MWHPIRNVPHELGYIYVEADHYYVMRDRQATLNWQDLEEEAYQEVSLDLDSSASYYPLTWSLLKKAEFPPREQDKVQQTFVTGDGSGRVFVRHLEHGKPIDEWKEAEAFIYVTHIDKDRYIVQNKHGTAVNWEELESQARDAAIVQEGWGALRECPPDLAHKAILPAKEFIKEPPFPWEETQISSRTDATYDFDFER